MCVYAPIDAKAREKKWKKKTDWLWVGLLAIHNTAIGKLNADSSQNFLNGISLHVTSVFLL